MRWALAVSVALAALPAAADPVFEMCVKPGKYGPEQCDCVAEELRRALSPADLALYSSVARRYLDRLGQGLSEADAWDAAVRSEALARQADLAALARRTERIEERHARIIARCGG